MDTTAPAPPIRCVTAVGFKHHNPAIRRDVLIGAGQEIDLSSEDFDRLHARGAVYRKEEVIQHQIDEAAARLDLLRAFFEREPTEKDQEDYARVLLDKLPELLATQRKSQEEWQEQKAQRLRDKQARDEAAAQADYDRHQKAATSAKKRIRVT